MDKNYLGAGIKFPLQVNRATGRLVMSEGSESIRESIYLILNTHQSERFARSQFGSRLSDYTFMDLSATWMTIMKNEIREDILTQEPRIAQVSIELDESGKEDCVIVDIEYTIIAENKKDNFVFPYYIKN